MILTFTNNNNNFAKNTGDDGIYSDDGTSDDDTDDDSCISWSRKFFNATKPYASAGAYVNFMTAEEDNRVASAYGSNYDKLVEVKRKYDPDNILHMNQNIKP